MSNSEVVFFLMAELFMKDLEVSVAEAKSVVDVPGKLVVGVPVAVGLAVTVGGVPVVAAVVVLSDLGVVTLVKDIGVVGVGVVGVDGGWATGLMFPKDSGVIGSVPLWCSSDEDVGLI